MGIQFLRNNTLISAQYDVYSIQNHQLVPCPIHRVAVSSERLIELRVQQIKTLINTTSYDTQLSRIAAIFETLKEASFASSHPSLFLKKKADSKISFCIHEGQLLLLLKIPNVNDLPWQRSGSFKTVSCILGFPESVQFAGYCMAKKRSKVSLELEQTGEEDPKYHEYYKELVRTESLTLTAKPVLWFTYTSPKTGGKRILSIERFFPHTLRDLITYDLPAINITTLFLKIINELIHIHQQGYFHGDIKLDNALWRSENQQNSIAVWTDFGRTKHTNKVKSDYFLQRGFYGTPIYTPPEVIGQSPFLGDIIKVEVWSIGCMLIEFATKKTVLWASDLKQLYTEMEQQSFPHYSDQQQSILQKISFGLQQYSSTLPSQPLLRQLAEIGLQALRMEPKERLSLNEIAQQLEVIKQHEHQQQQEIFSPKKFNTKIPFELSSIKK